MRPHPRLRGGTRRALVCLALAGLVLASAADRARGELLFVSSQASSSLGIQLVDTSTNTVRTVLSTTAAPDSLIFDTSGNIVYTTVGSGSSLSSFNPTTGANHVIATGFSQARDIALEPGGASVLVGDFLANQIDRVNLSTGVKTVLANVTRPDGVTYDNKGDLFAVINRGGPNQSVVQLNPTTGQIIKSLSLSGMTNNADGITFDPSTGNLWVGFNDGPGGVIEISTSLTGATLFSSGGTTFADGVEADGQGHLFIANVFSNPTRIAEFDISSGRFTQLTPVAAIDDLAPITGLGAPPVPEPSSLTIVCLLVGGLAVHRCWRRRDGEGPACPFADQPG
jgi:sugar lactone lactonase YvrE